jgi:hypothetical protein
MCSSIRAPVCACLPPAPVYLSAANSRFWGKGGFWTLRSSWQQPNGRCPLVNNESLPPVLLCCIVLFHLDMGGTFAPCLSLLSNIAAVLIQYPKLLYDEQYAVDFLAANILLFKFLFRYRSFWVLKLRLFIVLMSFLRLDVKSESHPVGPAVSSQTLWPHC